MEVPQKIINRTTGGPSNSTAEYLSEKNKPLIGKDIHTLMFTAALLQ